MAAPVRVVTNTTPKFPWMPLYVAEWVAATRHLTAEQDGCYRRLVDHYWIEGGLPNRPSELAAICGVSLHTWSRTICPAIAPMFKLAGWRHKRVEAELEKARAKSEMRSKVGKAGRAKQLHGQIPGQLPTQVPGQLPEHNSKKHEEFSHRLGHGVKTKPQIAGGVSEARHNGAGIEITGEFCGNDGQMPRANARANEAQSQKERKEESPPLLHGGGELSEKWQIVKAKIKTLAKELNCDEPLMTILPKWQAMGFDPDTVWGTLEGRIRYQAPRQLQAPWDISYCHRAFVAMHSPIKEERPPLVNGSSYRPTKPKQPTKTDENGREWYTNLDSLYEHVRIDPEKVTDAFWIQLGENFRRDRTWLWQWPDPGKRGCPMPKPYQDVYGKPR